MWWRSFAYLKQHGLRQYHASGPAVIVGLAIAGVAFSHWLTERLKASFQDAVTNWLPTSSSSGAWWDEALLWGSSKADWLIEWGVVLFVLWLKVKVTKYLLITLMAPLMSALAAAVGKVETGMDMPFSWKTLVRDLLRGLRISMVLLFLELALGAALWMTGLILTLFTGPLVVLLSPALLMASWLVGAYFFGAAVYDAVYEQGGLDWRASLRAGWQQRGHLVGLGAVFSLIMAIPFVGPYLAALLGPVPCTTAAARLFFSPTSPSRT